MSRNIIVFSDGTSNTRKTDTNVYQFFKALNEVPHNHCFYDPGVGSFTIDVLGKAFGAGMADNIQQCYRFIVDEYEDGDRLFLFGFSRGAYTVRSLANFVRIIGLVAERDNSTRKRPKGGRTISRQTRAIRAAYDVYRSNKVPAFKTALVDLHERQTMRDVKIYGLGVWDTVGAVGLPSTQKDKDAYGEHYYHLTNLPDDIHKAYHALAIDDERREFAPVLFSRSANNSALIEELWFPGMHSDVGGGYKATASDPYAKSLSNISLNWMAEKFADDLEFDRSQFGAGDPTGPMHDSMDGVAERLYTRRVRGIPKNSRLHSSVAARIAGPLQFPSASREADGVYRPRALKNTDYEAPPLWGLDTRYDPGGI